MMRDPRTRLLAPPLRRLATSAAAVVALGSIALGVWARARAEDVRDSERTVEFGRDIRPLLSNNCFVCHGPGDVQREAELRLDLRGYAFADRGGYFAIVPGNSSESELYLRITDADDPMPPPDSDKALSPDEIELIRRWIDEGARWDEHWAYRAIVRPPIPTIAERETDAWAKHPIDRFLLARLSEEALVHERRASRETLIRRASLDLTGLPPTIEEVDRFLNDDSDDAYGELIDRLLASPRYGEHMARAWLDAARYGDTHGFHFDNERAIWPYRDWVIEAFNQNLPFDQFTIEQLAGDLLPNATLSQRIATGFNRCNPTSAEGGMIAEEYLAKYASDRAVTTAALWMGTTLLCAQCHDHKFDPISQSEFYELFAFFNSVTEEASDKNALAPPPMVLVPNEAQSAELNSLAAKRDEMESALDAPLPEVDAAQAQWSSEWKPILAERWTTLATISAESSEDATLRELDDGSILAEGPIPATEYYEVLARCDLTNITAIRLEALQHESLGHEGVGRASHSNIVLSGFEVAVVPPDRTALDATTVPFVLATADYSQADFAIEKAIDGDASTGWAVDGKPEPRTAYFVPATPFGAANETLLRIRLRFESGYEQHQIGRFRLSATDDRSMLTADLGPWSLVGPFQAESGDEAFDIDFGPEDEVDLDARYGDEHLAWTRADELADGELHELSGEDSATYVFRTITSPSDRILSLAIGSDDAIKVWLNGDIALDLRVARSAALDQDTVELPLVAGENRLLLKIVNYGGEYAFAARRIDEAVGGLPVAVARALEGSGFATPERTNVVRNYFRRTRSPEWKAMADEAAAVRAASDELEATIPKTLVMEELAEPRPAYVLARGRYDRKGAEVAPNTPDFLPRMVTSGGGRATRLDLARWLVDPTHPLTARVMVNRFWQELFGTGIVATAEDFGSQGEWPSHPELLDWLASEFIDSGWDIKRLLRLMMTSEAYRQRAHTTPEKLKRDPANRLLARGPRFRLDAERIRDTALAASGLLVESIGGPSVRPYQPDGLWQVGAYPTSNTAQFTRDEGDALYRRSLYTFWKRTAPPPTMQLFDAPTRESCTVTRARTNTPLQALALMNDVQFVEAARAFATRVLNAADDESSRLIFAFRTATSRRPDSTELEVLKQLLHAELEAYSHAPRAAMELISVGEMAAPSDIDPVVLAAWTHVTNLLLNLDEVVTKG